MTDDITVMIALGIKAEQKAGAQIPYTEWKPVQLRLNKIHGDLDNIEWVQFPAPPGEHPANWVIMFLKDEDTFGPGLVVIDATISATKEADTIYFGPGMLSISLQNILLVKAFMAGAKENISGL